jgi:membrane protease YdiL (CAAX protease family)
VQASSPSRAPWAAYEALIVLVLVIVSSLLVPGLAPLLQLAGIAYFLIERPLRHRSWRDIGLDPRRFPAALRATWPWVLLVGFGTQILEVLGARLFWPALSAHILSRASGMLPTALLGTAAFLLLSTLLEELLYRGLFQERLSWLIGVVPAVALVAIGFGLMHIAPGDPAIVAADVMMVIVDGAIFGIIFAKGRDLFTAWLAHYVADIVGLALLLLLR